MGKISLRRNMVMLLSQINPLPKKEGALWWAIEGQAAWVDLSEPHNPG
jgi:hypothetical protein